MVRKKYDVVSNGGIWTNMDHSNVIGGILEMCIDRMEYMSDDALKQWLLGAALCAEETLEWEKNSVLSKRIKAIKDFFLKHPEPSRELLMNVITNIVLSSQGMPTLSGFRYKRGKGVMNISPEHVSSRKIKE